MKAEMLMVLLMEPAARQVLELQVEHTWHAGA